MKKKLNIYKKQTITVNKKEDERVCTECNGTGLSKINPKEACPTCGGEGKLDWVTRATKAGKWKI